MFDIQWENKGYSICQIVQNNGLPVILRLIRIFTIYIYIYVKVEYAKFSRGFHFFCFRPEIPFLGKFDPKSQNYQFKVKLDT